MVGQLRIPYDRVLTDETVGPDAAAPLDGNVSFDQGSGARSLNQRILRPNPDRGFAPLFS